MNEEKGTQISIVIVKICNILVLKLADCVFFPSFFYKYAYLASLILYTSKIAQWPHRNLFPKKKKKQFVTKCDCICVCEFCFILFCLPEWLTHSLKLFGLISVLITNCFFPHTHKKSLTFKIIVPCTSGGRFIRWNLANWYRQHLFRWTLVFVLRFCQLLSCVPFLVDFVFLRYWYQRSIQSK